MPPAPRLDRPTPRRAPPSGSEKYDAILDAAEALFGAHGFQKAGVDEIAAGAGVSKPLIYRYFTSKQHLFELVVDRVISEWCEIIVAEGARTTPSAAHTLRRIVRASLAFATSREVLRGLLARESQLMLAGYSDVLERGTATLCTVVGDVLARGIRAGEVRTDLDRDLMAKVMTEVCVRFVDQLLASAPEPDQNELLDTIVETLLHGVIVKPDAITRT